MDRPLTNRANRTFMGTVIFIDIVEYSKMTVAAQVAAKSHFNDWLSEIFEHFAETDRITLDTGDGAALCFLGDPEDALFAATALRDQLRAQSDEPHLRLRVGINIGPVRVVKDINGQPNIIGDGINCAQRIMAFAAPDQIVVSRPYFEVVSCLSQEYTHLFHYLGIRKDKHVRTHEIYEVGWATAEPTVDADPAESSAATHGLAPVNPAICAVENETIAQLKLLLARYMGPIAVALVHKACRSITDREELGRSLADNIPDSRQQTAFLRDVRPLFAREQHHGDSSAASEVSERTDAWSPAMLTPSMLTTVEQRLAAYVGPVAKLFVARAAVKAGNIADLYRELATTIDQDEDRKAFMATRNHKP